MLKELLTIVKFEFLEFEVICLKETWCKDDRRMKHHLKNYTSINQVRKHGKDGGKCGVTQ